MEIWGRVTVDDEHAESERHRGALSTTFLLKGLLSPSDKPVYQILSILCTTSWSIRQT